MMFWKKPYARVMIQIFLVISMTIAFSFIIHEGDRGLVSASDFVSTCIESNQGEICQEYTRESCGAKCNGSCIQTSRDNVPECQLGVCFNPVEGDCLTNSPKKYCEDFGGEWNDDIMGNIPECQLGCCLTGEQSYFITEQKCRRRRETTGALTVFKPEIKNEIDCWVQSRTQAKGACILGGEEGMCRFMTQTSCVQLKGDFSEEFLCSHPILETGCEKQNRTSCIEGEDEVYWIDSCGNRENIYEGSSSSQKDHSWNNGKVLLKLDACNLTDSNADVCGNCYLIGGSTICGEKTFSEKLKDDEQDVVCKEASCIDEEGNKRVHGESWCAYQGAVNPDGGDRGNLRSVATPGSRHFKFWCFKGEVSNVSCGERREGICEETQIETLEGETISSSTCRSNAAPMCLVYNSDDDDGMKDCKKNPDCYVKKIAVKGADFDFKFCVPKYPWGFNLKENKRYAKDVCNIATMTCTAAKIKEVDGYKWVNKGCLEEGFTRQMNDFCMSLGDCGASVNYKGAFTEYGYRSGKAPKLSGSYIDKLKKYDETDLNEIIESASIGSVSGSLGIGDAGDVDKKEFEEKDDITKEDWFGLVGLGGGIGGSVIWLLAGQGAATVTTAAIPATAGVAATPAVIAPATGLSAFLGVLAGAVIGLAIVGTLIDQLGISAGLPPELTYALLAGGAIGGGMVGFSLITSAGTGLGAVGMTGLVGVIIVIIIIIILAIKGVGDVKYYKVRFTCKPWQPPNGGKDCSKCYEDGFGCSEYACESLGAGCRFLNEGSVFEECKHIPSDVIPPQISPNYDVLSEGFSYEDVSGNGFKVSAPTEDGCIPAYTPVTMGIKLHEAGRCTFAVADTAYREDEVLDFLDAKEYDPEDFGLGDEFLGLVGEDDSLQNYDAGEEFDLNPGMQEFYFGGNNLFLKEHIHPLYMPSLGSLGVGGFAPGRRVEFDLKIRCEDTDGNRNPKDYVIRVCLMPEKDIFPPIVLTHDPLDDLTKYNSSEQDISIYTNEPSECKWSTSDKDYTNMENDLDCKNDPEEVHPRGFRCSANLPVDSENMTYYARCLDQPWLKGTENESDRHVMNKSHVISLKRSEKLEITSIYPEEGDVLIFGTEPASLDVEIETSGGGYNGKAECSYLSDDNWISLFNTFDSEHGQTFNQFSSGHKLLDVKCEDIIGNVAYETAKFEIKIDNEAPKIVRAYYELDKLKVITNEPTVCYYDYYRCNFDIENASSMTLGLSTTHTSDWEVGRTYHIKCIDTWNNWESDCSKVIKPGEF